MRAAAPTLIVIGAALWLTASSAQALGFGRVGNATQLGQPLNFSASVRLDGDETLSSECVSAEVLSGDNKLLPSQVRATLESGPDPFERSARVTTTLLIDEPVVTVSVTLGCSTAKVTRRFVLFVDPPLINVAQATPLEALPPQQRTESQVGPIVNLVQGDRPAPRPAARPTPAPDNTAPPRKPRPRPRPTVVAAAGAAVPVEPAASQPVAPKRPAVATRQPSVTRPATPGPRLQLEAAAPVAARVASAPAAPAPVIAATSAAPAVASAPAAPADPTAEPLAREQARLQSLEDGLAKLRSESQATQKSLATLQARLKDAESERYANPLVYTLAGLSALLALAVAGLWWRQSRTRQPVSWWTAPGSAAAAEAATSGSAAPETPAPAPAPARPGATATAADAFALSAELEEREERERLATAPPTIPPEPVRELSVEELIDLEQQAEFFIVLGQDDAAIDLLMSHVRNDGGISPLPYLKLLEIYRRRGESEPYERIRERFNRRFNAYAPDWASDAQEGRSLEDYPATIATLQGLWTSPARVMETLDASLFRRNRTDETFDLPAYRELLFLYSIARDLAEHGESKAPADVDLLLPLDTAAERPIERLVATAAPGAHAATMPVDLDVSYAPSQAPANPAPATVPYAPHGSAGLGSGFVSLDLDPAIEPAPRDRSDKT